MDARPELAAQAAAGALVSRCRRHGRARRKARCDGRRLAARIMTSPSARAGDASRVIRDVIHAVADNAVRACGELRRPRLVSVSVRGVVMRWPGAGEYDRRWLTMTLRRCSPAWLHLPWVVVP